MKDILIYEWNKTVWNSLENAAGRLTHALLIHGPAGVGKRALAEHFAQFLLCEGSQRERPCGRCEGCRWFAAGNHPDVRWLEPEAIAKPTAMETDDEDQAGGRPTRPSLEIKVEQVRALADFLNIGSHRGRHRIVLVYPAEDMNLHAANSLLKSLEEPPASAVFVLVSHRPARLLATVRSRCVASPVRLPERAVAEAWLRANGVADAARWLAFAGGAPLRALEYGSGARGETIARLLKVLQADSRQGVTAGDREEVDVLAEVLQKLAFDRAFAAFGVEPKYATGGSRAASAQAIEWLAFARAMGHNRALARHPLNPRLFASDMLSAMPALGRPG
ncbi:MAG: DNA polymerase III subunit delta' [Burkholderiales bacterium]